MSKWRKLGKSSSIESVLIGVCVYNLPIFVCVANEMALLSYIVACTS